MFKRDLDWILRAFNRLHDRLEAHVAEQAIAVETKAADLAASSAAHGRAFRVLANLKALLGHPGA